MPCASSIEEAVSLAEQRWPHLEFKIKTNRVANSSCPVCGGDDRFVLFDNGYFFCHPGPGHCAQAGWLDDDQQHTWTPEEIRLRKIESDLKHLERQQADHERRLTAIERLNRSNVHERYYNNLDEQAYTWWMAKGCELTTIHDYKLGYCPRCPTDKDEHRPSYTIPVFDQSQTKLLNLRHRLAHTENGDKYRPEMAGLGTSLFGSHHLIGADMAIILEGSIKSIVTAQYGLPTVGIFGKRGRFKKEWLDMFPMDRPIYIGLDPDATENAERLAAGIAKIGKEAYVIDWPMKPDDMFVAGCTKKEWMAYVNLARRVH